MKLALLALILIVVATAIWVGRRWEATAIQQTCEADDGATILNGTQYLCLSQRQIEIMRGNAQRGA